MAKVLITEGYLSDIADAIREKKASEDTYTPAEMADAIESIQTGISPSGTKSVTITSNGTTTEDVTNYASAEITVNVPSSSPTLVTKNITENGTYNASSDNADGYSSVTVNVSGGGGGSPVETPSVDLVYKEVTVGTNSATDGASVKAYLNDLAGVDSSSKYVWYSLVSTPTTPNNLFICGPFPDSVSMYRYRGGNIVQINFASGYDAVLPVGSKYMVAYAKWKGASLPTA